MATAANSDGATRDAAPASRSLVAVFWRRRIRFASVAGIVAGLVLLLYLMIPTSYRAVGSIVVAEPDPGQREPSVVWGQKLGDPADLESQILIVGSPRMIRLASGRPGVAAAVRGECEGSRGVLGAISSTCDRLQPGSDAIVAHLEERYTISSVGRSRIISVAYRSNSPENAKTITNGLIEAFLEDQKLGLSSGREVPAAQLRDELKRLNDELREKEGRIQDFRAERGLQAGSAALIASERLTSIGQQLSAAEAARAAASARLEEVRIDQKTGTATAPSVLSNRVVADIKQQLNLVQERKAAADVALGPLHPQNSALDAQVDVLRRRLATEIAAVAASSEKEFNSADRLVTSLKRQLDRMKADVAQATTEESSIESLVRDVEIKKRQYADLAEKANALETDRAIMRGNTRLVSLAELPTVPFFPKRLPFFVAGLTLAMLAGAAAALAAERGPRGTAEPAVPEASSAPEATEEPPVVVTPAPQSQEPPPSPDRSRSAAPSQPPPRPQPVAAIPDGTITLPLSGILAGRGYRHAADRLAYAVAATDYDPQAADALRELRRRARESARALGRRSASVMICAAHRADDKAFLSLALARSAARDGLRVLLIEADLDGASFAAVLEVASKTTIADFLRGRRAPSEVVVPTRTHNLDVVLADRRGVNLRPVAKGAFGPILALGDHYDLVIVDAPSSPTADVDPDLLHQVDGVFLCSSPVSTELDATRSEAESIEAVGGRALGIVVVKRSERSSPASLDEAPRRIRSC